MPLGVVQFVVNVPPPDPFDAAPPITHALFVTVVMFVAVAVVPAVPEPFVEAFTSIGVVLSTPEYADVECPDAWLPPVVTVIDAPSVPSHTR